MVIKEVFFLCKEAISPNIRYIKALGNDMYVVHEIRKNNIIKYTLNVVDNKINILEESEQAH